MLKCLNCGAKFDEPVIRYEYRGEFWGSPAYEPTGCCPECGDDQYEEDDEEDEDDSDEISD